MDVTTTGGPNAKPATAAQQQQFDMLLDRARQLMGATDKEWLQGLQADPVQSAVTMGTSIVRKLAMASEEAGQPVDPAVLLNVGIQFVKDIAAVANTAGFVPDEQLPAYLKDVLSQSVMTYLKMDAQDGMLSPEDKANAEGMLAKMQGEEPGEAPEPAGEAPGPDNTQAHEGAETAAVEGQEGDEEDQMTAQLAAIRKAKGVA